MKVAYRIPLRCHPPYSCHFIFIYNIIFLDLLPDYVIMHFERLVALRILFHFHFYQILTAFNKLKILSDFVWRLYYDAISPRIESSQWPYIFRKKIRVCTLYCYNLILNISLHKSIIKTVSDRNRYKLQKYHDKDSRDQHFMFYIMVFINKRK